MSIGREMAQNRGTRGRILYGTVQSDGTVAVAGNATPVSLPSLVPLAENDYVAIWIDGGDMLVLGPVDAGIVRFGSGGDVSTADGTGELQLGPDGAANIGMDGNEIQARSGGAAATLTLQFEGGDLNIGPNVTSATDKIRLRGEFENWTDVTFSNSWQNYGSSFRDVQYRKVGDIVFIRGLARKNATYTAQTIFVLPSGYRPAVRELWSVRANTHLGEINARVDVLAAGDVQINGSSTLTNGNWVSFHHQFSTI